MLLSNASDCVMSSYVHVFEIIKNNENNYLFSCGSNINHFTMIDVVEKIPFVIGKKPGLH